MNTVLKSVRLGSQDAILVNDHTYSSVVYACESVCDRNGCRLASASVRQPRADGDQILTADEIVDAFERQFDANPDIRIAVFGILYLTYCTVLGHLEFRVKLRYIQR